MNHRFFVGDNVDVLQKNRDLKFDLVLTSPGYNIAHRGFLSGGKSYQKHDDNIDSKEYIFSGIQLFNELQHHLSPNGVIIYNLSYGTIQPSLPFHLIAEIEKQTQFRNVDTITWKKKTAFPLSSSSCHLTRICELIFVFAHVDHLHDFYTNKKQTSQSKTGQKFYSSLFNFVEADNADREARTESPTKATFSEDLVQKLLDMYAPKNCTVLDPFTGSGTTNAVCAKRDLKSFGIDIDKNCIDFAISRINEILKHKKKT